MKTKLIARLEREHSNYRRVIGKQKAIDFLNQLLSVLFPEFGYTEGFSAAEIEFTVEKLEVELERLLNSSNPEERAENKQRVADFFNRLDGVYDLLLKDIKAILNGDPAANDETEVIQSYPGFLAISVYRIAHELDILGVKRIPRILTEYAHEKTGIDIHPRATIGESFCIDHGTGIVIGETAIIGKHVKLYQGVTLGALSVSKRLTGTKRHPTIENNVVIYAGATILGGSTVIGKNSVIGGNSWITESVAAHSTVFYSPTTIVKERRNVTAY